MKTVGSADTIARELLTAVEADRVTRDQLLLLESDPYY